MSMKDIAALGEVAEAQWGLITTRQAEHSGVSRMQTSRLAAAGVLHRVAHGVYRMAGAPELEDEEIFAAWLSLVHGGRSGTLDYSSVVARGTTAARLHRMGDMWMTGLEFVSEHPRTSSNRLIRVRTGNIDPSGIMMPDGIPVTTPERTIADLLAEHTDRSLVVDALRDAHDDGKITPAKLERQLEIVLGPGKPGRQSTAELVHELLERAGIQTPIAA